VGDGLERAEEEAPFYKIHQGCTSPVRTGVASWRPLADVTAQMNPEFGSTVENGCT
jgi:hypothetical protein